jgi:outer membrane protein OmpA-like peptidoglycan-associated protein
MRRATLVSWTAVLFLGLGFLGAPAARATSEDERPAELGFLVGVGLGDEKLVGSDNDTDPNLLYGGRLAFHFGQRVSMYIDGTYVKYSGDSALFGDTGETALRLGPEWYVNPRSRWQFFVNLGVGGMRLRSDLGGNDGRGFASLGLGVRRGWPVGALRMELRGDRTVTSAEGLGGKDFTLCKAVLGWTFGIGARPKDSDGDGVFDKKDKCPDTPQGAVVDKDGCPVDSDGDGVADGIDLCPDTPKGWPVDAKGCPIDSDGDGVADGKDSCPDTPKGCTVNAEGCPADADGDGVCEGLDQCANTPQGCRVDARGCEIDSDGDKVCDGIDQCPGTPAGLPVDAKGCPPPPPPPAFIPEPKKELVLERVFFETDKATLKPESTETLDKVAASLKDFPDVKIQVAGHTDNTGSAKHNMKLSEARAATVMNYLISKGVDPAMLSAKGYGKTEPIADNKTAEGRAQNRRVGLRRVE